MDAKTLTLNIAVNLGRMGRWACEGKGKRVQQFLTETEGFVHELERLPKSPRFQKTFNLFYSTFVALKSDLKLDERWAETMFTWADILTHRAKVV